MESLPVLIGILLLGWKLPLVNGQCTYQFPASRTMLALETQTIVDHGGVILFPGNVMAATFRDIPHLDGGVNISGASLFVIPTYHAVSSALIEVAVALGTGNYTSTTEDTDADADAGSMSLDYDIPRNASHLELGATVDGWSISDAQSTKGSVAWDACRYYEVGNIQAGVQEAISEAVHANGTTHVEVYLRHHSGTTAFIEGNQDTYARSVVLQIRGSCGWNTTKESTSSSSAISYWDYTESSAAELQGYDSSYFSGLVGEIRSEGPIEDGRRHPLCGGAYLDDCDLGPFRSTDVGDGSCQQHLNTEGCSYDGGDCCSITCALRSTSDKPYNCHETELDPYFCIDPEYAIDITQQAYEDNSAQTTTYSFSRSLPCSWIAGHLARRKIVGGLTELRVNMLAMLTTATTVFVASINKIGLF